MNLFVPLQKFEKHDDGTLEIWGVASSEAQDSQGEIVKASAVKAALPDFFAFGTGPLREMHQPAAAGSVLAAEVDERNMTHIHARVVDPVAVRKVEERVYKGFSLGGTPLQKVGNEITRLKLAEISLVDRPANPDSIITLWKSDDPGTQEAPSAPSPQKGEAKYGDVEYADEKNKKYPIDTEKHVRAALFYWGMPKNRANYSAAEQKTIGARISAAARRFGMGADSDKEENVDKTEKIEARIDAMNVLRKWAGEEVSDVACAISALMEIVCLYRKELDESLPGAEAQLASLADAVKALKAFIVAEIQESEEGDVISLAHKVGELQKMARGPFAKIGAEISAANMEKIQAIHDHAADLGADCRSVEKLGLPADGGPGGRRYPATTGQDILAKLAASESLVARFRSVLVKGFGIRPDLTIDQIEALPAPSKARHPAASVVTKAEDGKATSVAEKRPDYDRLQKEKGSEAAALAMIKDIHASAGVPVA